jgi:hypothetical protein
MPISEIVELLTAERDKINRAIEVLEEPEARATAGAQPAKPKGPAGWTAQQRKAHSLRVKQMWARKKEAALKEAALAATAPKASPKVATPKVAAAAPKLKGPAGWTEKQRKAHGLRMKKLWAARRAAKIAGKGKTRGAAA